MDEDSLFGDVDVFAIVASIVSIVGVFATIYFTLGYFVYRKAGMSVAKSRSRLKRLSTNFGHRIQSIVRKMMEEGGVKDERESDEYRAVTKELEAYRVPFNHVTMVEVIGKGAYGEVWAGKCNGVMVAVKKSYLGTERDCLWVEKFRRECSLHAKMQMNGESHPNIVQMVYCCWEQSLLLMLHYHPLGSLLDVLSISMADPMVYGERMSWIDGSGKPGVLSKIAMCICDRYDVYALSLSSNPSPGSEARKYTH